MKYPADRRIDPRIAPSTGKPAAESTPESEDAEQVTATWQARAIQARAQPVNPEQGARDFIALWRSAPHAVRLDDTELSRWAEYFQYVRLPAQVDVISQDERGDFMLVILEGTIAVDRLQLHGGRTRLVKARPGDMLGEMAMLDAGTRFSTCSTVTSCVLAVLDAEHLGRMITDEPKLALALYSALSRRLSLRLRQASARLGALLATP